MVSIIMPMYNVEKYIGEAVESVLAQTYPDWELIVVDDGSVDDSFQICKTYAERDERIRLIHKENGGVSSARNRALECAAGEWIYFMDADDRIVETCFETVMNYLKQEDVDIISWNYMCEEEGIITKTHSIFPERFIEESPKDLIKEVFFPSYADKDSSKKRGALRNLVIKFIHKDIIQNHHIRFNETIKIGEDALFAAMCYGKARRVMFVNEYLYYYRRVADSADRRYREDIEEVFDSLLKHTYYFLQDDLGNIETCTGYAGLAYDCMARAMEKKFAHPENPAGRRERVRQIKEFSKNEWMIRAFSGEIDWSVFKPKQKALIYCMRWKLYGGMYALQKIKELTKKG